MLYVLLYLLVGSPLRATCVSFCRPLLLRAQFFADEERLIGAGNMIDTKTYLDEHKAIEVITNGIINVRTR
jgi:hypothetical protein